MADRTITKTGIVIGGHFIEPPPRPSADAEAIQRALLTERAEHAEHVLDFIERNIGKLMVAMSVIGFVIGLVAGFVKRLLS